MSRYEVVGPLGEGGMGTVELVRDARRGELVARKRVLDPAPAARLRFKREFRVIQPLRHPNVIALHELDEDEQGLFFTMEHVAGSDVVAFCRGVSAAIGHAATERFDVAGPTTTSATAVLAAFDSPLPRGTPISGAGADVGKMGVDEGRLDSCIVQMLRALRFLHGHGIVHRDIKPANVLVTAGGDLKLLDFGILAEVRATSTPAAPEHVGTLAFMAPEQLRGEPPTTETDLYALGVLLFIAAAGRLPFVGSSIDVVNGHLHVVAPRLADAVTDAPGRYDEACARLLAKSPAARPSLDELEAILFGATSFDAARDHRSELVGRETLTAALNAAIERARGGAPVAAALYGPTGVGKTALLDQALRGLRRFDIVLRGAARASEHLPFNAADGVMDDLAQQMGDELRVAHADALAAAAALFPVLGDASAAPPSGITRAQAFAAITRIVAALAERTLVVVRIDDAQWADRDAIGWLEHMLDARTPRVVFLLAVRDDVAGSPATDWLATRADVEVLPVSPLDERALGEIVKRTAAGHGRTLDDVAAARIAAQCAGRAMLAVLAGHETEEGDAAVSPASGLVERLRLLPASDRRILATLVASDHGLDIDVIAELTAMRPGEVSDATARMERDGLVRRALAHGAFRVDVYHDQIARALEEAVGAEAIRDAHAALADRQPRADADLPHLVRHLEGAGRTAEAAALAERGAKVAERQRAYALAASLLDVATRAEGADVPALLRRRAAALDRVGDYQGAAACWHEARRHATGRDAFELGLAEAQSLLGSNAVVDAFRALDAALRAAGEPPAGSFGVRAIVALLLFVFGGRFALRIRERVRESASSDHPAGASHAQRAVETAQKLMLFDPLASLRMVQRTRRDAAREGEREIAAWCDVLLACTAVFVFGGDAGDRIGDRYRRRARATLAGAAPRMADVRVSELIYEHMRALRELRWTDAAAATEAAIAHSEEHGATGSHEHLYALSCRAEVAYFRGDAFDFERWWKRLRDASRDRGTGSLRFQVVSLGIHLRIWRGDLAGAETAAKALLASWPTEVPTVQRMLIRHMLSTLALSGGRPRDAWTEADAMRRDRNAVRPFDNIYGGALAAHLALVEVAALRDGDPRASKRRVRALIAIGARRPPLARASSLRALAYLVEHEGHPGEALRLLREAEAWGSAHDQIGETAITRRQIARRIGGTEGEALLGAARAMVVARGWSEETLERAW